MKVLDVALFQEGLHKNLMMFNRLGTEMKVIEQAVEGLVSLDDAFKGEGGNAIRSFYAECHLPFLQFYAIFQRDFITILEQMRNALDSLEPHPAGFIRESFLETEIEQGLTQIAQITESLTDEANSIMNQVADIVGLPQLDDSDVQEGVQHAKIKRNDTVQALHEFDSSQTSALVPMETSLAMMENWLSNIESLFTDSTIDVDFPMERWAALSTENSLKTDLMHRTESRNTVISPQDFGYGPGNFYGTGVYSLPGMATQASPLYDSVINGATMSGNSAFITVGGKSLARQVTSTSAEQVDKPKKKTNKVLGFLKSAADLLILDDVKTVFDPKTSLLEKGSAIFSITPTGKMVKAGRLGFKLVRKTPFGKTVIKKVDRIAKNDYKYWNKTTEFKGIKVYQRDDLINPNLKDARGRLNRDRMKKGLAPLGPDGKSINLHHTTQRNDSSIAEVTQTFHKEKSSVIHINPNTIPSGINRNEFNKWRKGYWKNRKNDF